jgi:hypothetical protein
MLSHEVHEFLALEEPGPHVVSLTGGNDQLYRTAEIPISLGDRSRIGFQRHDRVDVAVDREQRNAHLG